MTIPTQIRKVASTGTTTTTFIGTDANVNIQPRVQILKSTTLPCI